MAMRRLFLPAIVGCALLGSATVSVATAAASGYLTPLFARAQYSGPESGSVSMDTVKPFFDHRNLDAAVSVVTQWPAEHQRVLHTGNIYLSWDDLHALQDDGWTITSHGRSGLSTNGASAPATNSEINGSLTDLLKRGFNDAWSLYSYKGSRGDALAQKLVKDSYAYGRENTSLIKTMTLPMATPERAVAVTTWGGHCNDTGLSCYRAAPEPYRLPRDLISAINGMTSDEWMILQAYRFVQGTSLSGKVQFDCTGPSTQHWARVGTGGREIYCWNDYQAIIDGVTAQFEPPTTIAGLYGRGTFAGQVARAGAYPETLGFGTIAVGNSSTQALTFMNTGTAPLSINSVRVTGTNPGDFQLQQNTCSGAQLPGGGSCTVSVRFAPTATGTRSATVRFSHTATGSPLPVSVTGTGR
jgi:Abnormal spindle-like microcephaly-assoc'd, ASPM-SPD-2-Hydin